MYEDRRAGIDKYMEFWGLQQISLPLSIALVALKIRPYTLL